MHRSFICRAMAIVAVGWVGLTASQHTRAQDYPPLSKVTSGYTEVSSKSPSEKSLCKVWRREKDAQMLIELPKDFARKKYFIALTVSSGDSFAGLQSNDFYVYWRKYNNRLALIQPNLNIRSTGEAESKASVKRLFTDSVLLDIPIVTMAPNGGPVIDADSLLVNQSGKFFGGQVQLTNYRLTKIVKAKVFEKNIEIAFEIVGAGGKLQTIHYSLSEVPTNTGYRPRVADQRVGYFVTGYTDLGIYNDEKTRTRYINRWQLEKADPNLKLSPPKRPIVFYIEHTTPIRYRRFVKQGVEYWNKAFEKIGFADAIVIQYQDAKTGAFMDLDPEDVQYNFIRWLNNDVGTAIGPSRVNPQTGQILDADIVLTDGWIRTFNFQFNDLMPKLAMEGMSQETLNWLARHPKWDPRVRFADDANRLSIMRQIAREAMMRDGGHPISRVNNDLLGDDLYDGLVGRTSQVNGYCLAATGKQLDMASARIAFEALDLFDEQGKGKKKGKKRKKKKSSKKNSKRGESDADESGEQDDDDGEADDESDETSDDETEEESKDAKDDMGDLLDGMPDSFIGPLLADLVAHEVGHTLGLRHNFRGSSRFTFDEINSEEVKDKQTIATTVMDYISVNIPYDVGEIQGNWTMIGVGPYDYWAIEYGYTTEDGRLSEILKRCNEPELLYATDEDTSGPDPYARRYDYSKNPLDYAENQIRLNKVYRDRLLDKFVKDGDSWSKARRGYELTISQQMRVLSMMANWIGGAHIYRAKKGDPGDRNPIEPVSAEMQREALNFVIENSFEDESFGLTPEILQKIPTAKWIDDGFSAFQDSTFPIHDRILAIQASSLTMIMNPTTLRRVLDNEQLVPVDEDALTLPELLDTVSDAVWTELDSDEIEETSARKPLISSLRRNLQREHIERLIDLAIAEDSSAAMKPVQSLASTKLRTLLEQIGDLIESSGDQLDPYTLSHLTESKVRIEKALDANYIINMPASIGGGLPLNLLFGQPEANQKQ